MVKIIALAGGNTFATKDDKGGDISNVFGTQAVMEARYEQAGIEVEKTLTPEEITALFEGDLNTFDEQYILLCAGEPMLDVITSIKKAGNVVIAWSGHQPSPKLETVAEAIDVIHLPEYTIPPALRDSLGKRLITTPHGVPHHLTPELLNTAYEAGKNRIPEGEKYLLVTLGGDAPTTNGEQKLFTAEEAHALGKYAGEVANGLGYTVLATNAPRTGVHTKPSPLTQVAPGEDAVSVAFKQGMAESGLAEEKAAFFPFDPTKDSDFPALLGAVAHKKGSAALMPGDSATMLTQAMELLPKGSLIIYPTAAMNENHAAQVESLIRNGWAMRQKPDKSLRPTFTSEKPSFAAETVANSVINALARHEGFPSPAPAKRQIG